MLASGTIASTTWALPRLSVPWICPRRLLRSPMTSPMNSSGVTTSTFITGSSSLMPAFAATSRIAARPAISNASAGESHRRRRRVGVVIRTIGQANFEVDDREADHVTIFGRLAHALLDRRDIFARNVTALDLVDEGDARTTLAGRDADLDAAELART